MKGDLFWTVDETNRYKHDLEKQSINNVVYLK